MAKPPVDTAWAVSTVAQYVLDVGGNTQLVLNKTEPSNSYKSTGVPAQTPVIRGYVNYWQNAVHQMLSWIVATEVGTVLEFKDSVGMTSAQLQSDRGGVWQDHGTYTKAGLLTRVFSKTS